MIIDKYTDYETYKLYEAAMQLNDNDAKSLMGVGVKGILTNLAC
jgi:hypothetical protein